MPIFPKTPTGGGGSSITDYTQVPNLTTALSAKGDKSVVDANTAAIATKAEASAVTALQATVAAKAPALQTVSVAAASTNATAGTRYLVTTNFGSNNSNADVNLPVTGTVGDVIRVKRVFTSNNGSQSNAVVVKFNSTEIARPVIGDEMEFVWNGTSWDQALVASPNALVTPPSFWFAPAGSSAQDKVPAMVDTINNPVKYRGQKCLKYFTALADLTASRTAVDGFVDTCSYALSASGALYQGIQNVQYTVGYKYASNDSLLTMPTYATPISLVGLVLRLLCRIDHSLVGTGGTLSKGQLALSIEVSSDNFTGTDISRMTFPGARLPMGVVTHVGGASWRNFTRTAGADMTASATYTAGGAGANLASINAIRFRVKAQSHNQMVFTPVALLTVPKVANPKAKFCITFDDSRLDTLTNALPVMNAAGFVGTAYTYAGEPGGLNPEGHRLLRDLGWQVAAHQFSSAEHNGLPTGDALRRSFGNMVAAYKASGMHQYQDWALYGNFEYNGDTFRALEQVFRSGRSNEQGTTNGTTFLMNTVCQQPPANPLIMECYLWGGSDDTTTGAGTAIKQYIDQVIAEKGIGFVCLHALAANGTVGFNDMIAYLQTKVASGDIEVVTVDAALAPSCA